MFRKAGELHKRHSQIKSFRKRRKSSSKRPEQLEARQMLTGYAEDVLALNPIAYWNFDEQSGSVAENLGSLGNTADGLKACRSIKPASIPTATAKASTGRIFGTATTNG